MIHIKECRKYLLSALFSKNVAFRAPIRIKHKMSAENAVIRYISGTVEEKTKMAAITKKAKTFDDREFSSLVKNIYCKVSQFKERDLAVVYISFKLGLRSKEIASLKVSHIINAEGELNDDFYLERGQSKGSSRRTVYIAESKLRKVLKRYLSTIDVTDRSKPLFLSQRKMRFNADGMRKLLSRIFANNGFGESGASSHSGRRSMITKLANAGVNLSDLRVIAGHSSVTTTQIYIDTNPDKLADIMKSA